MPTIRSSVRKSLSIGGVSVLIPAFNEEASIIKTIESLRSVMDLSTEKYEIIVIDDGSKDRTAQCAESAGVRVLYHPSNGGYGRALKTGINHAKYDWCAIVDADGSYPMHRFPELLTYIPKFDMVVGARAGPYYWGSTQKRLGRIILTGMVQYVVGKKVPDVNSGMRVFRKETAVRHIKRISSGFSFTTTLTLALFLDGCFIKYIPIEYHPRVGRSKVKIGIDSLRTMQILVQVILFYNPLKLFLLVCVFTLVFGLLASLVSLLMNGQAQCWLVLFLTVNITVIIGCLGLIAEALHLNRLS